MGTQLTRQPLSSSSEGNLFFRVRFRGVPSTVEQIIRVRVCCSLLQGSLQAACRFAYTCTMGGREEDSEKVLASQERVSGFPEKGATSGEARETSGEVQETSGKVWELPGNPWIAFKFHSERTSGEVAEKLPGKFGQLPGKSGDFPEARGSLTPSQRLAKFISKRHMKSGSTTWTEFNLVVRNLENGTSLETSAPVPKTKRPDPH